MHPPRAHRRLVDYVLPACGNPLAKWVAVSLLGLAGCRTSPTPAPTGVQSPEVHVYREVEGQSLRAYVFFPERRTTRERAAVLLFHGGGWSAGSAEWTFASARRYADWGMVAISIEYRLSQDNLTPIEAFSDTCAAFQWVRLQAKEFNIKRDRVAGYGVSAGGHLVAAAGTGCRPSDSSRVASSRPDALLLWSPALDVAADGWFRRLLRGRAQAVDLSPVEHAGASTPPTSIVHGVEDTLTPVAGVKQFRDRVVQAGGVCELNLYEGVGHLLTRNLASQESDFDPDPIARADGIERQRRFLRQLGFIRD